jgi:FtsP/CotA-like multicopper oxidase with cupredoxin domain
MKTFDKMSVGGFGPFVVALICLLSFTAGTSYGADYYLRAGTKTIAANTFNNPAPILMWGYARCPDASFTNCSAVTSPGPTLTATEGEPLNIHLRKATAAPYVEPSSIIIPGQPGGNLTPTWTDGTTGPRTDLSQRVRSFTAETPPDNTTVVTYTWPSLKAGTYLYQSGTHPAVQVQMGLYGALIVYTTAPVAPATSGQAYSDLSSAFDSEAILVFSEIDPVLHNAVATGTYGLTITSTIDYHPKYFLVNGKANTSATQGGVPRVPAGAPGQRLLIRFLNASVEPKVPVVQGPFMSIIAEDGNFMTAVNASGTEIPAPKQQYSVLLPPGKTMDAIMTTPATAGYIPVYDRRLSLSNGAVSPGGMLVNLRTQ